MGLRRIFDSISALVMSRLNPRLAFGAYEVVRKSLYTKSGLLPSPRNDLEALSRQCTDINEHLTTLSILVVENNLKTILELGVRDGESTLAFLQAAKVTNGMVFSADINPCPVAKERVVRAGLDSRWDFKQGDDKKMDWSIPLDLLFIDTSHEYEHTLLELRRFEPHVSPGGFIILHDVVREPGVAKALSEYMEGRTDLRAYRYFGNNGLEVIRKLPVAPVSEVKGDRSRLSQAPQISHP